MTCCRAQGSSAECELRLHHLDVRHSCSADKADPGVAMDFLTVVVGYELFTGGNRGYMWESETKAHRKFAKMALHFLWYEDNLQQGIRTALIELHAGPRRVSSLMRLTEIRLARFGRGLAFLQKQCLE